MDTTSDFYQFNDHQIGVRKMTSMPKVVKPNLRRAAKCNGAAK